MEEFKKIVVDLLAKSLSVKNKQQLAELIEVPAQRKFGHFAFPCFHLAKKEKKNPAKIAEKLAETIEPGHSFAAVKAVGPYLNFTVHPHVLADRVLKDIFLKKEKYGLAELGQEQTVVIEFSSPNIAKPFGIGHLRSTNIGACLSRVYKTLGYRVIRINHLGDWGTQFGKLITAYKRFGTAEFLKEQPLVNLYQLYVRYHQEEEEDPSLSQESRGWFAKLENKDEEALELWEWFRELSIQQFNKTYKMLAVEFDYVWGESFYRDKVAQTINRLQKKKLLERSQEALVVRLPDKNMPPVLIKKSDDSTLYATRDICAAEYRQQQFNFNKMLYVVGTPQQLHFRQVFAVLKKMGYSWADDCQHIDFGHITLASESGQQEMSTRKGNIILLQEVIDKATAIAGKLVEKKNSELENKDEIARKVGIGAVLFADLSSHRQKEVKFDLQEILNFEGETGPYLQYAFVRMKSLNEKYSGWVDLDADLSLLDSDCQADLIYHLATYQGTLEKVVANNEPFYLARYLITLAKLFSRFYHDCRIIDEQQPELSRARMLLVNCSAIVLKSGLGLLGIAAPEKM